MGMDLNASIAKTMKLERSCYSCKWLLRGNCGTQNSTLPSYLVLGVELDLEDLGTVDLAPCALADDLGGEHKVLSETKEGRGISFGPSVLGMPHAVRG